LAYYEVRPKIQVAKSDSLNERDPFATQFTITNDSFLSVRNVDASCGVRTVTADYGTFKNFAVKGPASSFSTWGLAAKRLSLVRSTL